LCILQLTETRYEFARVLDLQAERRVGGTNMTTVDLLVNHGIPVGWTDALPWLNLTNQQPHGFHTHISVPGEELDSADSYTGPDDAPVVTTATVVPECRHIHKSNLPANEQPGAEHALILEGEWVYKVFSSAGAFSHDIYAWVRAPADGLLDIGVPVQVHYNPKPGGDGSPGAAVWRLWIDDRPGDWRTFGDGFTDRQWMMDSDWFGVDAGQVVTLRLQLESRSQAGIDFFTDLEAWEALFTPDNSDDPEAPTHSECRGAPRVEYTRVVNVVPKEATRERYREIAEIAWERSRETVTGSYDDAGVGDITDRTAILWDIPQTERHTYISWYMQHYPDVLVKFDGDSPSIPPIIDPPIDPPSIPPSIGAGFDNLPKALSAGLHFTAGPPGKLPDNSPAVELPDTSMRYISEGKPSIVKGVSGGDLYRVGKYARQYSPGTRTVWRRVVGDGNYITGNLRDQAQRYLDQYKAEAETASRNLGITPDELWNHIDYISGLNELISNWGGNTDTQVEFECNFADLVDIQIQHNTKATMLAVAIGNPSHEPADILRMLPAAQMSAERGHILDYHAYWTAGHEPGLSYLDQEWQWYAGRWTEWDKVFTAKGVAPLYMFGESGMVYDPTDGTWVGSGKAWRDAGSILYFLDQIKRMNVHIRDWNATHGNRCLGGVLFTCIYSYGWDNFLIGNGDLLEILKWMRTL